MFQKCPICDGTGLVEETIGCDKHITRCDTCKGRKIINSSTGHPPLDYNEDLEKIKRDESELFKKKAELLKTCKAFIQEFKPNELKNLENPK